jgi:hypothetical protein
MQKKLVRKSVMSSKAIQQVNDATIVLRHFIELSAKLLPFFNDLSRKEDLLPQEAADRTKIIEVYRGYRFDTSTSLILMNSTILDTIQTAFEEIEKRIPGDDASADDVLGKFFAEHDELVQHWVLTDCN